MRDEYDRLQRKADSARLRIKEILEDASAQVDEATKRNLLESADEIYINDLEFISSEQFKLLTIMYPYGSEVSFVDSCNGNIVTGKVASYDQDVFLKPYLAVEVNGINRAVFYEDIVVPA